MIVYEHEHGDTMMESAEQAVKLANAVGHTVQLRNNDTQITIHTFSDPRAIVEQWGPTRGEYDSLKLENEEQRNIIDVHKETIATQSKLIVSLRESVADVRRANSELQNRADRTNKANVDLVNQLIDLHYVAEKILNLRKWADGHAMVPAADINALSKVIREQQAVRILPNSEAEHA